MIYVMMEILSMEMDAVQVVKFKGIGFVTKQPKLVIWKQSQQSKLHQ